jgi:putative methanogenesis marker protein 6
MGIHIKQTCYGILIEGPEDIVEKAVVKLREIDPNRIFSKMRAFPLGDKRRCRAQHGSARPGFYFLEKEIDLLPHIAKGMECAARGDHVEELPTHKKLEPSILKKIMEESV